MHISLARTDSTNSYLRRILAEGLVLPEMTIVSAWEQTAGRGQKGNSWESEPGKNVLCSILCRPAFLSPSRQFVLSQCIALAISQTLSEFVEGITVKWPNDIYWNDKKISGTLIECDLKGREISSCIIGSGINVNQTVFRSDAPNPISLSMITGLEHDADAIIEKVAERFEALYRDVSDGKEDGIMALYMSNLYRREGFHAYEDADGAFQAEIVGVEPTGHLQLRTDQGEVRRYEFKEVKFLIPNS